MNPEDEERWIERTESDPDFADAVWAGAVPEDEAPSWYPRFVRLLDAARTPAPPTELEAARTSDAWAEVQRRAQRRRRRRRMVVVRVVAVGAAVAAGATAAAAATDVPLLPEVRWESPDREPGRDADPVEPFPVVPAAEVTPEDGPSEVDPPCPKEHSRGGGPGRCGEARADGPQGSGNGKKPPKDDAKPAGGRDREPRHRR